jgi:dihydropyrimidinase
MQNSCDLLITNANVVIPKIGIIKTNILIENQKIKYLTKTIDNISYSNKINANGKVVLPGLIDPHIHYGVFSPIEKASKTESRSAAIGGVTTIMRMLRLNESYSQKIGEQLKASEKNHFIDYAIHASILNPNQIEDIPFLCNSGITSFKLYMNLGTTDNRILMDMSPYENKLLPEHIQTSDDLYKEVIKKSSSYFHNSVILVHAEDHVMCSDLINKNRIAYQNKNYNALEIWSKSRPAESEVIAIKRIMRYGRNFQSNIYFVHIGSNDALDAILREKQVGGCNVYVETCPHYLTHSTEYSDIKGKVVPPLRSKGDIASLWMALRNGVIDTIGTDHVANVLDLKYGERKDIWTALAGFPGVATMLPVLLHYGVNAGQISIEKLVELTSYNASKIFGMFPNKGTIQKDSDADLVIVDLDLVKKVNPNYLQSSSDYSIYEDYTLQGWPVITISRGEIIMENGVVYDNKLGHGKFIKRNKTIM